mgnify:CR=1 FL=1
MTCEEMKFLQMTLSLHIFEFEHLFSSKKILLIVSFLSLSLFFFLIAFTVITLYFKISKEHRNLMEADMISELSALAGMVPDTLLA